MVRVAEGSGSLLSRHRVEWGMSCGKWETHCSDYRWTHSVMVVEFGEGGEIG